MDSKSLFQNIHLSWLCLIAQPRVFHVGGSKQHSLAEREVSLPPWLGGLSGKSGWVCCKRGALMDDVNRWSFARKETQRRGSIDLNSSCDADEKWIFLPSQQMS